MEDLQQQNQVKNMLIEKANFKID